MTFALPSLLLLLCLNRAAGADLFAAPCSHAAVGSKFIQNSILDIFLILMCYTHKEVFGVFFVFRRV